MDIVFSTTRAVLSEAEAFARSAKQAGKLRKELETEVSSTKSMLDQLQDLVKEIGNVNGHGSPNTNLSADLPSGGTVHSLLKLDDINVELQKLQEAVGNVHTQLESINSQTEKEKLRKRFGQILRPEKGKDDAQALLTKLRSIHTSASWLAQRIPM